MIPVSHIGKSNYEQLGNQRVGETHQSRMARVNAASANQPTLVGNPAIPQVIQGSKPMGAAYTSIFGDPLAYGLLGGLTSAALASLYFKDSRGAVAMAGIAGGAVAGSLAGRDESTFQNPLKDLGGGWQTAIVTTAAALTLSTTILPRMYQTRKKANLFSKEVLLNPVTLTVGLGVPALIGASLLAKDGDQFTGGAIGAMAGAAMVALFHQYRGVKTVD